MSDVPKFIHDTRRIISLNEAALELFRCEPIDMIDADLMEFLPNDADRRWLVNLRLGQMRKGGAMPPPFSHVFRRCDMSEFWAAVTTDRLPDGTFETTVLYIKEK